MVTLNSHANFERQSLQCYQLYPGKNPILVHFVSQKVCLCIFEILFYFRYNIVFKLHINSVSPLSFPCSNFAYPGFSSMKRQSISTSPTDGMQIHRTHLYTWVERGSVRVKCLAQQHNTWFEDPETSTLTMKLPRLPI